MCTYINRGEGKTKTFQSKSWNGRAVGEVECVSVMARVAGEGVLYPTPIFSITKYCDISPITKKSNSLVSHFV
jgi:hypothetical protein